MFTIQSAGPCRWICEINSFQHLRSPVSSGSIGCYRWPVSERAVRWDGHAGCGAVGRVMSQDAVGDRGVAISRGLYKEICGYEGFEISRISADSSVRAFLRRRN